MNPRLYTRVLEAVLTGDEDEARRTVLALSPGERARLYNAASQITTLTEDRRKTWRA